MGYAASWGIKNLPEDWREAIKTLLAKFDFIGVLEKNGIKVCEECDYKETSIHGYMVLQYGLVPPPDTFVNC